MNFLRQGHRRLYSSKDLAELAILSDLRRRGFSLQRVRKMICLLRQEFGHRLSDLLSRGPGLHLLTDGESVFLCDSERGVIDLLRDAQQPLLAICVGPVLERVLAPASEMLKVPQVAQQAAQQVSSRAPKKSSQPVRAAVAARAKARP